MTLPPPSDKDPTRPDRPDDDNGDRGEEVPPTPPTEPDPAPVQEPPDSPGNRRGPYIVD